MHYCAAIMGGAVLPFKSEMTYHYRVFMVLLLPFLFIVIRPSVHCRVVHNMSFSPSIHILHF